jgi:uncharacterized protein (AIM24 family)
MRSALFASAGAGGDLPHGPTGPTGPTGRPGLRLQNPTMLKVELDGETMARTGSVVAYQGQVRFQALNAGTGMGRWLRHKLTGEGVPLMKVTGQGDLFLAERAAEVHLIDLEPGDALTVNGANVLAFESTVQYEVKFIQGLGLLSAAGLFNCVFTGSGRIAVTTRGTPVVLRIDRPTYADPQAAICWSASLETAYHRAEQLGLNLLLGRDTAEAFTMSFSGEGLVVVQPCEEYIWTGYGNPAPQPTQGTLGGLFGG